MWLERRLDILQRHDGPIVLAGDPAWGAPYLIHALNEPERPLVWCELEPRDDPVLQGNKLADAVKCALESPLFGYGMPYGYGLNVLRSYQELLGPFTFVLTGAEYAPEFARELLAFRDGGNRVILAFAERPDAVCLHDDALLLAPEALRLAEDEAFALAGGRLTNEEVLGIYERSEGVFERFLVALNDVLGLPAPLRPWSEGLKPIPGLEPALEPAVLLNTLLTRDRYLEALEFAAAHCTERVPEVLDSAGDFFWARGLESRVSQVLERLPARVRQHETVLVARLVAALSLGSTEGLLPEVAHVLNQHDLPNVRALYAEALYESGDLAGLLREAARAARTHESVLTFQIYGDALSLSEPEDGLRYLERAFELAERERSPLKQGLIAKMLSGKHTLLGNYRAGISWAAWGRRLYQEGMLEQVSLRLSLLNEWAYARILGGEVSGLEAALRQEATQLEKVKPSFAQIFESTLADVLLCQGRPAEALELYRRLWRDNTKRQRVAALANLLVRALLEVGEYEEALQVTQQAVHLTQGLAPVRTRRAKLAYGMALAFVDERRAIPVLQEAMTACSSPRLAARLAQAALHLARCYLLAGKPAEAEKVLTDAHVGLAELSESGRRYLAGPAEAFREVFKLYLPHPATLELSFLGRTEARYEGRLLELRPRFAELLAVLAHHPDGLTAEALTLAVYGERGDPRHCRLELSRLRKLVPVSSRPYRIAVDFKLDAAELEKHITSGRVTEALELYRGPLLPASQAPFIVETREFLEESLRRAVLGCGDAESLWTLAERLKDDLELWEEVLVNLSKIDPRRAVAQVQIARLKRDFGP